jgi:hypothetical protein
MAYSVACGLEPQVLLRSSPQHQVGDAEINGLATALEGNTHCQDIDVSGNAGVTDASMGNLRSAVQQSNVVSVIMHGTAAGNWQQFAAMRRMFVPNAVRRLRASDCGVKEISWGSIDADDADVIKLAEALMGNTVCTNVRLSGNDRLTDASITRMTVAVRASNVFRVPCVGSRGQYSNAVLIELARALDMNIFRLLRANDAVLHEVPWNGIVFRCLGVGRLIRDADVDRLADALESNTRCREVNLGGTGVTDASMGRLRAAARRSDVVSVCLEDTAVSTAEKAAMKCVLLSNVLRLLRADTLDMLGWQEVEVDSTDIAQLAEALRGNTKCHWMELPFRRLTDACLSRLTAAVERSAVQFMLYLHADEERTRALRSACESNRQRARQLPLRAARQRLAWVAATVRL